MDNKGIKIMLLGLQITLVLIFYLIIDSFSGKFINPIFYAIVLCVAIIMCLVGFFKRD